MARIAFIQNIWYEQLGLALLSAYLKANRHASELFIESGEKDYLSSLKRYDPSLIAFSVTTGNHTWALKEAQRLKSVFDVPVVMGGPHATYFPEVIRADGIDLVCRGEGEDAMLDLANCLDNGRKGLEDIPNYWFKSDDGKIEKNDVRGLEQDLDLYPFADRDLFQKYRFFQRDPVKHILTGRGCPFLCTYCFNHISQKMYKGKGKYLRRRSVDNVLSELEVLKEKYKPNSFIFVDDTFFLNRQWIEEFFDRYAEEIRVPFVCDSRPELIKEDLIVKLKRAGCFTLRFGLESGNEKLRKMVLNRNVSNEQVIRAGEILHRHGIKFCTYNMLGLPNETETEAFETLELNARIKADFPLVTVFHPYPGTLLGDRAMEEGLVAGDYSMDDMGKSYFRGSVLDQKDIRAITNLQKLYLLVIRLPRLKFLYKVLIRLPPNPIFEGVYLLSMGWHYAKRTNRGLLKTLIMGVNNLPFFFKKG